MSAIKSIISVFLTTVCILLSTVSCRNTGNGHHSRREIMELADSAEILMYSNHGKAMDYIIAVDPQYLHSHKQNARYALLYSEALNANRIPVPDDSLIMIAVRYYSTSKDIVRRFRAYYTLGCIYDDLNQLSDAAVAFAQAEQLAGSTDNEITTAMLYSRMGKVYSKFFDYERASRLFRKSADLFEICGRDDRKENALYDLACCRIDLLDFQSADSILDSVQQWAFVHHDRRLLEGCLSSRMSCALYGSDTESAGDAFNSYISLFGQPQKDSRTLGLFALYYVRLKDYAKAESYFSRALDRARTISDVINLYFQKSAYYETVGMPDSALTYHKQYVALQNEYIRDILGHPVLGAQKDYFKTVAEAESLRSSRKSRTTALLSVCFILAITVLINVWRSRRLKLEADKRELMLVIRELQLKKDSQDSVISQLDRQVNTLFSRQYAELDQVFDKMAELDEKEAIFQGMRHDGKKAEKQHDKTESFYKYLQSRLEDLKSERNQNEFDRIINSTYRDLMTRLSNAGLGLGSDELIILRLSITGFSVRTISRIMDISPKNIYQKRTRMMSKIEKNAPLLSGELESILRH